MRGGDKMRQVVNFFIIGLIFWIGWKIFPEYVQADSVKSILVAVVVFYIVETLVVAFVAMLALANMVIFGESGLIVSIVMALVGVIFAGFLALIVVSNMLSGFEVVGFWPKMILAFCCSVCAVSVKFDDERKNGS